MTVHVVREQSRADSHPSLLGAPTMSDLCFGAYINLIAAASETRLSPLS